MRVDRCVLILFVYVGSHSCEFSHTREKKEFLKLGVRAEEKRYEERDVGGCPREGEAGEGDLENRAGLGWRENDLTSLK